MAPHGVPSRSWQQLKGTPGGPGQEACGLISAAKSGKVAILGFVTHVTKQTPARAAGLTWDSARTSRMTAL